MRKLCFLGDSHVGVLARAYLKDESAKQSFDATFFAAHYGVWNGIAPRGRALVSADPTLSKSFLYSSRGKSTIEVDDYDIFVVVGLRSTIGRMVILSETHHSDSMTGPLGAKTRLSDECFEAAAQAGLMETEAMQVVSMLRSLTSKPIIVVPTPAPFSGLPLSELPGWLALFERVGRGPDAGAIRDHFDRVCLKLAAALKLQVVLLPREAAETGLLNRQEFSQLPGDFAKLSKDERVKCITHGNARYAAIVMRDIYAAASASPARPVTR